MNTTEVIDQVIRSVLLQSGDAGPQATLNNSGPNSMVANWIGSQFLNFLNSNNGQQVMAEFGDLVTQIDTGLDHYSELAQRDGNLAMALGACSCWGEKRNCEFCAGEGTPGWTTPDRELFSDLILPALMNLTNSTTIAPRLSNVLRG